MIIIIIIIIHRTELTIVVSDYVLEILTVVIAVTKWTLTAYKWYIPLQASTDDIPNGWEFVKLAAI